MSALALVADAPGPRRLDRAFYEPFQIRPGPVANRRRLVRVVPGETPDFDRALDLVDFHRRLDCPRYEECLDTAASQNWRSFSCVGCPR